MPRVFYGTRQEPSFELEISPDLIAVRTHSEQSIMARGPVLMPAAAELDDGTLVAEFPDAGVEVYRVDTGRRSVRDRKMALRAAPDVRFAGDVLVQPKTGLPILYTENIYVRFKPEMDPDECEQILRDAGLMVKRPLEFASNAYFAEAPEGTGQHVFEIAEQLLDRSDVIYCHPELIQPRVSKQVFAQQWHLRDSIINGVSVSAHVNIDEAHAITRGSLATIAVIDDGVDVDHPEFARPGKVVAPRDVTLRVDDARPRRRTDEHGNACAGVACAAGVDGAEGVAPEAKLIPIRLASGLGSMAEADAFRHAADHGADVISCSWGPVDGRWFDSNDPTHNHFEPLPASTRDALVYATTQGRGGKGCVVLFAAGNGRESVDNDGYASSPMVIAVAACNDTSRRSVYSDFGKAVWCCFPSNDFGFQNFQQPDPLTPGIWTTDRRGTAGYNPGDIALGDTEGNYTNSFGGTSSSCPGAAGVAALVISANPGLSAADVRDVLKRACIKIDPQNGQYDKSTGHSPFYGYGRLDAGAAVKIAKSKLGRLSVFRKLVNAPIPDLGITEEVLEVGDDSVVDSLIVSLRIQHSYIGDLVITLVPPTGSGLSNVVLHNRTGGRTRSIDRQYSVSTTPALSAFAGKSCKGTWTFRVEDRAAQDAGTLIQIELQLSIPAATQPPTSAQPKNATANAKVKSSPKQATKKKSSSPASVKKKPTKKKTKSTKKKKS